MGSEFSCPARRSDGRQWDYGEELQRGQARGATRPIQEPRCLSATDMPKKPATFQALIFELQTRWVDRAA
ncbi:MAG: hypothetical protein U1F35_21060 [Steroidobacteraceae bacterium]